MSIMKNIWIKRGIAGMLTVSLLTSMAPATFAQQIQDSVQTGEEIVALTEDAVETGTDELVDTAIDTETDTSAHTDTDSVSEADMDDAADAETDSNSDAGISAADDMGMDAADGEADTISDVGAEAIGSTEEIMDNVGADNAETEEITLLLSAVSNVSSANDVINVTDAKGLIELSHMDASNYCNNTIKIAITGSQTIYDLTQPDVDEGGNSIQFQGLGSDEYPFQGKIEFEAGSNRAIKTKIALFNNISSSATLPTFTFQIDKDEDTGIFTDAPLLAQKVTGKEAADWKVVIQSNETSEGDYTIGGIIDTLASKSVALTLTNSLTGKLNIAGTGNRGLFCNTMSDDTSMTATLESSEGQISVNGNDAGGFVGHMNAGTTLEVSGDAVSSVTSSSGNAGGLVGSAADATITLADQKTAFNLSNITITAGSNTSAGGLVGEYTNTQGTKIFNLSNFTLDTTLSGGSNVGGVFGALHNSDGTLTITGGNLITTICDRTSQNFGGLIGLVDGNLAATLTIQDLSVSSKASSNPKNYGGVIGATSNVYVEMNDLREIESSGNANTNIGGLVAEMLNSGDTMLNIGSVKVKNTSLRANNTAGGLVGYFGKGAIRLYGVTDLSGLTFNVNGGGTGQIVGKNGNGGDVGGIVYAAGTGNDDGVTGWKLIRCVAATVSDIGNWGEVVRLDGTKLKEASSVEDTDAPSLFYFDETKHTVTVLGSPANTYTIASVRDFVAYALVFDFAGRGTLNVLKGMNGVTSTSGQNIEITSEINLTGTGIFGIGRDNGANIAFNYFSGCIEGNSNIITLDIGSSYGFSSNGASCEENTRGSGLVYVHQSDWTNSGHGFLGMISAARGDVTVNNLTVKGSVQGSLLYANSATRSRAAAVIGYVDSGNVEFNQVSVETEVKLTQLKSQDSSDITLAAFIADVCNGVSVNFENCNWHKNSNIETDYVWENSNRKCLVGGLIGIAQKNNCITVNDSMLCGQICVTGSRKDARVGGLVAEMANVGSITISNLKVDGERVDTSASVTSGGLLGYYWLDTDVTFGTDGSSNEEGTSVSATGGVTISGSTLDAGGAQFGGLVYQATGYWDATRANSIVFDFATDNDENANSFEGKSPNDKDAISGLLVGNGLITVNNTKKALYLEMGTWEDATNAAYIINSNAVNLTLNEVPVSSDIKDDIYFDELVGVTKDDDAGNNNAVVSLAVRNAEGTAVRIDTNDTCNTYQDQLGNFKNPNTRYYYNLDSFRENPGVSSEVNSPEALVLWSVSQYAASNIRDKFRTNSRNAVIITSEIDLSGYSYYPVTPLTTVTLNNVTLSFDNETIETAEESNKKPSDNNHQHYLMHCGLLYNAGDVTVNIMTLSGTVGKTTGTADNRYNSGALIYGSVVGDAENNTIYTVTINNITLQGLRVTGVDQNTDYAPLLINKTTGAVTLNVDDLSTGEGYEKTQYAASSLIGDVGNTNATKLTLSFSNIALDSRISESDTNSVWNNGESNQKKVKYNTYHTIFTRATLLNSFKYTSDSIGAYNFNSDDTKVTYGVEISNTTSGKNKGSQYQYYDTDDYYVWDGIGESQTSETVKTYYTNGYLRYVSCEENAENNCHELDVNLRVAPLSEGCGTYGHPYQITDGQQLTTLANFLNTGIAYNWVVCVNPTVFKEQRGNLDYHTSYAEETDQYYICDGSKWYTANKRDDGKFTKDAETPEVTTASMRAYLRNAYYQIKNDIVITSDTYTGIGGSITSGEKANAFSGVIVGSDNPTVYISINKTVTNDGFGGLIRYSQGSVVKDLTVSYVGGSISKGDETRIIIASSITIENGVAPSYSTNNPFFGGVVGYCMGGDTIIDNVSVKYEENSVILSYGTDNNKKGYDRLIAVGGYVGLVGGAKGTDGKEKTGGGVVFRKFGSNQGKLTSVKNANGDGITATEEASGSNYFYCNPYIGRVLDGYGCYETEEMAEDGHTLENTDKNYNIPDIVKRTGDLTFDMINNVKVNSSQGLWLLSAIVNSGAGAMYCANDEYDYKDPYNEDVTAYKFGKPRSGAYEYVGVSAGENEYGDEAFWGGVDQKDKTRVSYLVKNYTAQDTTSGGYYAAQLTGGSSAPANVLSFTVASIDMSSFGNGFRGIGSSFGNCANSWNNTDNLKGRFLRIKSITGYIPSNNETTSSGTIITMGIDRHDYCQNYYSNAWFAQGAGLFVGFSYADGCKVKKLTLTGESKLTLYDHKEGSSAALKKGSNYERYGDICIGGFASRTINAKGIVTFDDFHLNNLVVYGGHHAGGAIGLWEMAGSSSNTTDKKIIFTNWSIKGTQNSPVSIDKYTDNDGSSGGLLGWCRYGSVSITGYGLNSEEWNIEHLLVKAKLNSNYAAAAGGLVGATDGTKVDISDVRAKNLNVQATDERDVGGLVAGSRDGGDGVIIKNCHLENISVASTNGNTNTGGILGYHERTAQVSGVTITETSSISGCGYVGGIIGNSKNTTILEDCHIAGTDSNPILIKSNSQVGGFIGRNDENYAITIKDCTQSNLNILSENNHAGGLVGYMNKGSTNASNVLFSNVAVATKKSDKWTGLLTSDTSANSGRTFNGYNILANDCKTGYNTSASVENIGDLTSGDKNGLWVGNASGKITLVAVGASGTNSPKKDVANGSAFITYADYPVDQTNRPTDTASPWLDVNPQGTLEVKGSETDAMPTTLAGNGVGYIMLTSTITNEDGEEETTLTQKSIAEKILEDAQTGNDGSRKYWNVKDAIDKNTFSVLTNRNNNKNGIYIYDYKSADDKTKYTGETFPILVVNTNNNAVVDEQLWNFIAAMTNTASGDIAKSNVSSIVPNTYRWTISDDGSGSFVKQDNASLTCNSKKEIRTNGLFDNELSQFTLLDVQYDDPTDSGDKAFHLYIPVLVVKVLTVTVNVDILEGTNYYSSDYTALRGQEHYATAGFGEPITAYIEYNYNRTKEEWQNSLDNGEDLFWYYKKTIGLLNADQAGTQYLPSGTKLLLLDKQNGELYEYIMSGTAEENQNCFDFTKFTLVEDSSQHFESTPICDLLDITAAEADAGTYVKLNTKEGATVRDKDGEYYRLKEDSDADVTTYTLTVGDVVSENGYLKQGDAYYLTMEVPETENIRVINNLMGAAGASLERFGSAPPNVVQTEPPSSKDRVYNDRYFFYNLLNQSELTVESTRIRNGSEQATTEMKQGDSIQITMSTNLSLTSEALDKGAYKPRSMYQQFTIDLKKYEKAVNAEGVSAPIGADSAFWTYQVLDGDEVKFTASGTQFDLQELSTLTIGYGGTENDKGSENLYLPKLLYATNHPLTVKLVVTLTYSDVSGFPIQADSSDGLEVHGVSQVANQESQLPITENKVQSEDKDKKRYYKTELSYVTLHYNAVQQGVGTSVIRDDTNAQLGINPSDEFGNYLPVFTEGYFDYSQLTDADKAKAAKIRYTVELLQKDNNGNYTISVPISGENGCWNTDYKVQVDSNIVKLSDNSIGNKHTYTYAADLTDGSNGSSIRIDFSPLSGEAFEARSLCYSNYKVYLTAELLDENGNTLSNTSASDYIIYTNARIYQGLVPDISTS